MVDCYSDTNRGAPNNRRKPKHLSLHLIAEGYMQLRKGILPRGAEDVLL